MNRWIAVGCMAALSLAGCKSPQPRGGYEDSHSAAAGRTTTRPAGEVVNPRLAFDTTLGMFVVELDADKAPETTRNFMQYVLADYYDGLIFHRVLPGTLIQSGRFTPDFATRKEGLREGIDPEYFNGLLNERGMIAMIRSPLMAKSTKAEFFINVRNNYLLDDPEGGQYVAFGRVVEGMENVDKIAQVQVVANPKFAAGQLKEVPIEPVVIHDVRLVSEFNAVALDRLIEVRREEARRREQEAIEEQQRRLAETADALRSECTEPMETTESGVQYCVVRHGAGAIPIEGDQVLLNFRGRLPDGSVLNDTFADPNPPRKRLSELIPGLREVVMQMREGSRYNAIIPPEQAFGAEGVPGRIPSNATILFEVELLEILPR
ncbi:MAG: peptidylprolyl isomerase [Phycisphaerae bacterium]|nr:peptidylprolyl isomerase [Phycisphaerae bacterium]